MPPDVLGPPWFQQSLVYYNDFEGATPAVNTAGIETAGYPVGDASGLSGRGLPATATLTLRGPALSARRPLTLSFWWALPADLPTDGGFGLFSLNGAKGQISAFCRGKGDWCALQRPAGVAQVYYFPGIQNVNDIYDFDLRAHLDLRGGIWHHTAAVFRRASTLEVYTDGRLVTTITTSGREWTAADGLTTLTLGGGVRIDDVAVLDRAIDGDLLADYYKGVWQLRHDAVRLEADGRVAP